MSRIHVTPINDLREHTTDGICSCQLTTQVVRDDDGRAVGTVISHNAWDKRELREVVMSKSGDRK